MNVITASETTHAPSRQTSARWSSYVVFTLCAILYLIPFMRILIVGLDEGEFLTGAVRIIHGQVFARDFFEAMGPGTFYWLAAFFKLFGVTFLASRICLFISSLGTAVSLYYLSGRVCSRYRILPCLILAGVYFGGMWPGISHHVDGNFTGLLSVVCLILWNIYRKKILLISVGLLTGVTTCIHLPKGVYLFCAFLVWLWLQRLRTKRPLAAAGMLTVSYFAVIAFELAYFWSQGALSSLFYVNFVFPFRHNGAVNAVVYALNIYTDYWTSWVKAFGGGGLAIVIASILSTPLIFVATLPLFLLRIGIGYKWKTVTPEIALYWLGGWALWLSESHRMDIDHLVFGSPILIILCIQALSESRRKLADAALLILAFSAVCLAGNWWVVVAAGAHTSETRVGKVAVLGNEKVLEFLNEHTSPGEEVFIYPYTPTYYFLSATTNPTRYSFLLLNYNTPAQYREVAGILDERRVRYVVWDTTFLTKTADKFQGSRPINPHDLIIEPYLESHYKLVEDVQGVSILERREEGLAKEGQDIP